MYRTTKYTGMSEDEASMNKLPECLHKLIQIFVLVI